MAVPNVTTTRGPLDAGLHTNSKGDVMYPWDFVWYMRHNYRYLGRVILDDCCLWLTAAESTLLHDIYRGK